MGLDLPGVPGCKGKAVGNEDYCYDPTGSIELSGGNDGKATNLQACTGECDSDEQCAAGLKCFQRDGGQTIPGCTGPGHAKDWDYCFDPMWEPVSHWTQDWTCKTNEGFRLLPVENDILEKFEGEFPNDHRAVECLAACQKTNKECCRLNYDWTPPRCHAGIISEGETSTDTAFWAHRLEAQDTSTSQWIRLTEDGQTCDSEDLEPIADASECLKAISSLNGLVPAHARVYTESDIETSSATAPLGCYTGCVDEWNHYYCPRFNTRKLRNRAVDSSRNRFIYCRTPPKLIVVPSGNSAKLRICEGDCNYDSDCEGHLKCFQRTGGMGLDLPGVPGCKGKAVGNEDYCYDPTGSIELSGGNDGKATNLQACTGECDSDEQCAAGLKCFQRDGGQTIPGCTGPGAAKDWDYCFDPMWKPSKLSETAIENMNFAAQEVVDSQTFDYTEYALKGFAVIGVLFTLKWAYKFIVAPKQDYTEVKAGLEEI